MMASVIAEVGWERELVVITMYLAIKCLTSKTEIGQGIRDIKVNS